MRRRPGAILALLLLSFAAPAARAGDAAAVDGPSWRDRVVVVPVKGVILPDTLGSSLRQEVETAFDRIERERPRLVVVEVDSPGGEIETCHAISRAIRACDAPTVALVLNQAISGGAMVATACEEIVMVRGSLIGDIQPMNPMGEPLAEREAEKFESYVRGIMELHATENGYPRNLLESMVSRSIELYEISFDDGSREFLTRKKVELLEENIRAGRDSRKIKDKDLVVEAGKLLVLSPERAVRLGVAASLAEDEDAFYRAREIEPEAVVRADVKEGKMDFDKIFEGLSTPKLMLLGIFFVVGLAGILAEMHMPGFGVPGAIGIIGFAGFFSILFLSGRATPFEIALFVIGIILLVVEIVLIPGFGVAGIAGVGCVLASLFLAFMPGFDTLAWEHHKWGLLSNFVILFSGIMLVAVILGILVVTYGEHLPFFHHVYHEDKLRAGDDLRDRVAVETDAVASERRRKHDPKAELRDRTGVALTYLRPSGKVLLDDGHEIDVVTHGPLIPRGTRVRVVDTAMNRIVVAALPAEAAGGETPPAEAPKAGPSPWEQTRRMNIESDAPDTGDAEDEGATSA